MSNQVKLITEAIRKQLEDAGKDLQDMVPDQKKLTELIRKEQEESEDEQT
jgi:hypothetical protein